MNKQATKIILPAVPRKKKERQRAEGCDATVFCFGGFERYQDRRFLSGKSDFGVRIKVAHSADSLCVEQILQTDVHLYVGIGEHTSRRRLNRACYSRLVLCGQG